MMTVFVLPLESRNLAPSASEYFVPSLNVWPISIACLISIALPQAGHLSSFVITLRSANSFTSKSRPIFTFTRCASFLFAPVTKFAISFTLLSATMRTFFKATGPENPMGAPVTVSIAFSSASSRIKHLR